MSSTGRHRKERFVIIALVALAVVLIRVVVGIPSVPGV
jgi:hypothetical protein